MPVGEEVGLRIVARSRLGDAGLGRPPLVPMVQAPDLAEEGEESKHLEQDADHGTAIVPGSEPEDQRLVCRTGFWRRTPYLREAAHRTDGAGLPRFQEQVFRDFLTRGILPHDFARLRCDTCAFERLVPCSYKGRGFWWPADDRACRPPGG